MFCLNLNFLQVFTKPLNLQDQGQQNLVMQVLKLVLNCFDFDFIGSSADESADDHCTIHIPTTWRTSKKKLTVMNGKRHKIKQYSCLMCSYPFFARQSKTSKGFVIQGSCWYPILNFLFSDSYHFNFHILILGKGTNSLELGGKQVSVWKWRVLFWNLQINRMGEVITLGFSGSYLLYKPRKWKIWHLGKRSFNTWWQWTDTQVR